MGLNFEFATSTRIIFENNSFEKVPGLIEGLGNKVFIVTGKNTSLANRLSGLLKEKNLQIGIFSIDSEPTTSDIEKGTELAKKAGSNIVVGIGGGSAIDSAKAIAALAPNKGELTDYLEVIGKGRKLEESPLPCIAIPTTSGTGAEVTKNSVIKSTLHKVKVSLRSDLMFPKLAVIDPFLTFTMPPSLTATTGVDALTHLLETFVSKNANPFIDVLCREGMKLISESLIQAFNEGNNPEAREKMAMASMLGGMALANVKLGAVHGFAGPLGGMFPIPHGAVCACLLPAVMKVNIEALKIAGEQKQLSKFDEVARILTRNSSAHAADGVVWVNELVKKLQIPSLSEYLISTEIFQGLVEMAKNSSSMKGNPVELDDRQLLDILYQSF
jgi:alcohol dehydrogenase class IV